jgi:hypothetical protein
MVKKVNMSKVIGGYADMTLRVVSPVVSQDVLAALGSDLWALAPTMRRASHAAGCTRLKTSC